MIFLDIEKAYDTVWITGLLYKLISFKLPSYLLLILKAFLEEHKFLVHINNEDSSIKTTPAGLPQGAVLSTTLFSLYISDIPHPPNTQLALYADDTAILIQSWHTDTIAKRLTQASSILLRYFTKWKLCVNIHKTEAILFTKCHLPPPTPFPPHNHSMAPLCSLPRRHSRLQTPLYPTYHVRNTPRFWRSPPSLPSSSS
jgi:hypothetical protein